MNSQPKISGKETAISLCERIVISSLLSNPGQPVPPNIEKILAFAPNGFSVPHAGEIALAIRRSKNNGAAPDLLEVLVHLEGEAVDAAQRLAVDEHGLPLALADIEAEALLKRLQHNTLVAALGEAWQEARENPEQSVAVGRTAISVIERAISESPTSELPPIVDAADFVAEEIPALPMLVDGLLHQGTKIVVGGGSKAFKTWLLSDLAISVAYGLPWLGFNCAQGKSLYVNFEIHAKFFQERLKVIAAAKGVAFDKKKMHIWNLRGYASPYHSVVPLMIERIKSEGYAIDILDPIYKLYGDTDENSAGEVAKLLASLETICTQTKAATGFGAHYSKGNQAAKESIDRISGSGVFARDPDSIISFTKHEEDGCFTVEPVLRNLPPVEPFVVRWKYPLMIRDSDLNPDDLKKAPGRKRQMSDEQVLSVVAKTTEADPITVSFWADSLGVPRTTLITYLNSFRCRQFIRTVGEGPRARQFITETGRQFLSKSTVENVNPTV